MMPNVPVVTTSTSLAAWLIPFSLATSIISSAVKTTACPVFIFSLISAIVLATSYPFALTHGIT